MDNILKLIYDHFNRMPENTLQEAPRVRLYVLLYAFETQRKGRNP